jgi:stage V sporulation protein R
MMQTHIDSDPERTMQEVWEVAARFGLDPFPTHFEIVPATMVYEFGAYGIPGRFSHWTHGKAYYHMKTMYDYGLSKIYELVINANPSQAFLLDTNDALENKMVMAHVLGHTDFFKNSQYFAHTNRQMPESVGVNADRIARYEFEHGMLAVERFLDAALALKEHIALRPDNAPAPRKRDKEQIQLAGSPFDDILRLGETPAPAEESTEPRVVKVPAQPERDLLYFLIQHARDLEEWQRDILAVVREEMLYFLPQMQTKIINEGWASFWHYRIMEALDLPAAEYAAFSRMHAGVVSPGGRMRINPYYLGFKVLEDIERRWDNPTSEERERLGRQPGEGRAKLFEVRETENDQSLLRKYLTEQLVHDLDLYTYKLVDDEWQVADTDWRKVRDTLVASMDNFGLPVIVVEDGDYRHNRELYLMHRYEGTELDIRYAEKTLQHLYLIWNRSVHLETVLDDRKVRLSYDGRRNSKTVI